jgi:pyruvate/2-oxoacid:ferredoxin oxidoreductase beta subunit/Pyruvate/2-oxoacid:ferredoxin oxidoreductase gamma subunit
MTATPYMLKDAPLPYCKGCGHGLAARALGEALELLALPASEIVVVTDIGCVGLADVLFATPHTVHTTHGRSTAFAAGMALADSVTGSTRLKPIVLIGDGGAMIGISHLIHAALLNADVTVLVHNNFLFGMTGGQNSAFSPLSFVTATTPDGNTLPPLDLARVLAASRASFVARALASDRELAALLARAIAHPGFAVVEILELCTGFATKWNPLTGAKLAEVAARSGYELGVIHEAVRPTFGEQYMKRGQEVTKSGGHEKTGEESFVTQLDEPLRLVIAGTAGERVQTAASLLAEAAMLCGLEATQKNDYPVTQGTGFSVSELILSGEEILFTGIEAPDAVLVVSDDGARELERSGTLARCTEETLVLCDTDVRLPELPGTVQRFPFRKVAGAKSAALAAAALFAHMTGALPLDTLWAAIASRFGAQEVTKTQSLLEVLL